MCTPVEPMYSSLEAVGAWESIKKVMLAGLGEIEIDLIINEVSELNGYFSEKVRTELNEEYTFKESWEHANKQKIKALKKGSKNG